jgi:hypothetical protein
MLLEMIDLRRLARAIRRNNKLRGSDTPATSFVPLTGD